MSVRALRLGFACVALAACSAQEPVTDADKALFLRVSDLAQFGLSYPDAEARESFSKARQFDGSYELTYKFESSEGEPQLYIHGSVSVSRKAADAMLAEGAEKVGLMIAFKKGGIEEREVPGVRTGKLTLLVKGEKSIGNVFSVRDGAKSHLFIMSGLYFNDAALWQKLIAPKLERLSRYTPEAKT